MIFFTEEIYFLGTHFERINKRFDSTFASRQLFTEKLNLVEINNLIFHSN